jgi:uncharacterized Zn-binding protein involved in type VI secretion|tara:strand:+ start:762 stop:1076 length:315 start_codon:yes stop_codon:yes gene_type:complete
MARFIHRQGDSRICGATTVTKNTTVRANNRFISIDGDNNTHGGGALIATDTVGKVRINGIPVILLNDPANPDSLCPIPPHCGPDASSASPNVRAGGNNGGQGPQ